MENLPNIWFVKRNAIIGYDETESVVVIASSDFVARYLAASVCGDEGKHVWYSPAHTSCKEIGVVTKGYQNEQVVIRDFKAR